MIVVLTLYTQLHLNVDIRFRVNDGGSTKDAIIIDSSDNARVKLPNDGQTLSLGAGNDLTFQHDGSNSYIGNGVGDLYITNDTNDKDIILRSDDGSGGTTAYLTIDGSATITKLQKHKISRFCSITSWRFC